MPLKKYSTLPISLLKLYVIIRIAILCMLLSSCSKDDFNPDLDASPDWSPEIAMPLAYTEIGIEDLAHANDSNTIVVINNEQYCTLIYHDRVFDLHASQLVQIPDQVLQRQFSLNNSEILTLSNNGQIQVTNRSDLFFPAGQDVEADSMILKNSELTIDCISDFPANSTIEIDIPGLRKNGVGFKETITLTTNGNGSVQEVSTFPLNNYFVDFTKSGTVHNTLEIIYNVTISGNGSGVSPSNSIQCNAVFQDMDFKTMYGYLGQQNIGNIADSIEISIFKNAGSTGSFTVAEPSITIDISNSIGIPIDARISQLTAFHSNQTNFVVATGIPDPLPVNSPSISQVGETFYSGFTMHNNNSNVNSLISQQPGFLLMQSQIAINPAGRSINFLTDSSMLAMDVRVELPLFGTANDFKIIDTVPFNYNDLEQVETLTLRINVENWFPMEAGIQLVFTDDENNNLDTLFLPGEIIIPSGILSGNDERVSAAGKKIIDQPFSSARIQKILKAKNIIVNAAASTVQNGTKNVKIFNDYKLKVKLGIVAKMKII